MHKKREYCDCDPCSNLKYILTTKPLDRNNWGKNITFKD